MVIAGLRRLGDGGDRHFGFSIGDSGFSIGDFGVPAYIASRR
ncbi:hypothetical protein [Thermoleptolyngbya sp.]